MLIYYLWPVNWRWREGGFWSGSLCSCYRHWPLRRYNRCWDQWTEQCHSPGVYSRLIPNKLNILSTKIIKSRYSKSKYVILWVLKESSPCSKLTFHRINMKQILGLLKSRPLRVFFLKALTNKMKMFLKAYKS